MSSEESLLDGLFVKVVDAVHDKVFVVPGLTRHHMLDLTSSVERLEVRPNGLSRVHVSPIWNVENQGDVEVSCDVLDRDCCMATSVVEKDCQRELPITLSQLGQEGSYVLLFEPSFLLELIV